MICGIGVRKGKVSRVQVSDGDHDDDDHEAHETGKVTLGRIYVGIQHYHSEIQTHTHHQHHHTPLFSSTDEGAHVPSCQ